MLELIPKNIVQPEDSPMAEQVRREIDGHNILVGRSGLRAYLYGFAKRLPDERFKNQCGCFYLCYYDGRMEIPFGKLRVGKEHSELFTSQTPQQFYDTICDAIARNNIPLQDIQKLQSSTFGPTIDKVSEEKLYEKVLPVYVNLRELGYNHRPDLTGR